MMRKALCVFNKYGTIVLILGMIFSCSSSKTESTSSSTTISDSTSIITDSSSTMSSDSAMSEQKEDLELPEEYMRYRITLFNATDNNINVMLGKDERSMELIKIIRNRSYTSGNFSKNPVASVHTNGINKTKTYKLFLGNQYNIVWDGGNKCYVIE